MGKRLTVWTVQAIRFMGTYFTNLALSEACRINNIIFSVEWIYLPVERVMTMVSNHMPYLMINGKGK